MRAEYGPSSGSTSTPDPNRKRNDLQKERSGHWGFKDLELEGRGGGGAHEKKLDPDQ